MLARTLALSPLLLSLLACDRTPPAPTETAPSASAASPAPARNDAAAAAEKAAAEKAAIEKTAQEAALAAELKAIHTAQLSVIVLHQVKDFEAYRAQFARQSKFREQAGLPVYLMSRPVGDSKRVLVHFAAESEAKVDAFLKSPELDALLDAKDAPESSLLWKATNVLVDLPPAPLEQSTSLYLRTQVKDIEKLKEALVAAVPGFRERGVGMVALLRSTQDKKLAILHLTAKDQATLEDLFAGPTFQNALSAAGASGERKPIYASDVR